MAVIRMRITVSLVFSATFVLGTILTVNCSSKGSALSPKSPWNESLAEFFDDSVDFTMNPQSLSGHWLYKYQETLQGRMKHAELVLGVKIVSITRKTDPEGKECKDLYLSVKANVIGQYEKEHLTLQVCDDAPGFDSFKEDDPRLFDRVYVAFLKLYKKNDDEVGIHWHLSPLSQGLKEGMERIIKEATEEKSKGEEKKYIYTPQE